MKTIAPARKICELVLQAGPDEPPVSIYYQTLRLNNDALDDVETGPTEASA